MSIRCATGGKPFWVSCVCVLSLLVGWCGASPAVAGELAATPPMGWSTWAQYQCNYNAQTIINNAQALISTGLATKGYKYVNIDSCWMMPKRASNGELQVNRAMFPQGMLAVADRIRKLGLKFGIYEQAGAKTCNGKFPGSGRYTVNGPYHFATDVRQFASWGAQYFKLDGCNVLVAPGETRSHAYRMAYAAASRAIAATGHKMLFNESAPAYFLNTPGWYRVLSWVGQYGQSWRTGTDIQIFNRREPKTPRFRSILWNYTYNLPLGRFQHPGNWDDPDYIIGGAPGVTLRQTKTQMSLWAMMSAPLILSSNVAKLTPSAVRALGNERVIAIDQDPLGRMATLVWRTPARDVLIKPLIRGQYAVAVLDHSYSPISVALTPSALGFSSTSGCSLDSTNVWTGAVQVHAGALQARIRPGGTAMWRITPTSDCGIRPREGAIVMTVPGSRTVEGYAQCLAGASRVVRCERHADELWVVAKNGELQTDGGCLSADGSTGGVALGACRGAALQRWVYQRTGQLVNLANHQCLSGELRGSSKVFGMKVAVTTCVADNLRQIWALPN